MAVSVLTAQGAVTTQASEGQNSSTPAGALQAKESETWKVDSPEEATRRAISVLGVDGRRVGSPEAVLTALLEDKTPFLSDKVAERPVWKVRTANQRLELGPEPRLLDPRTRTFDTFIDPRTGALLKIISRWPDGIPSIGQDPSAVESARQLQAAGREKYHAFARELPPVSFVEALEAIRLDGENPFLAKQLIGQYVLWSRMDGAPRAMWVITLRGITREISGAHGKTDDRWVMRYIVDPLTKRWVCASSTPTPLAPTNSVHKTEP